MTYDRIISFLLLILLSSGSLCAAEAWDAVKTYQYGDDVAPLLAVEAEVRRSTASPETKARTAARLAALLNEDTSSPGRQFVCLQLRLVGGAAEVPKLAEWLNRTEDGENARMALTDIRCEESLVPLRKALETFEGRALVGVIGSLAARNDRPSIPAFVRLLGTDDQEVAAAAASALGGFGPEGIDALRKAEDRISRVAVGAPLVRIASDFAVQGNKEDAGQLYELLSGTTMPKGVRRAAWEGTLRLLDDAMRQQTIATWLFDQDMEKSLVAVTHLPELSAEQFDALFEKREGMNSTVKTAFLEIMTERNGAAMLEVLLKSLKSDDPAERLSALRAIGKLGDPATIPVLLDALTQGPSMKNVARDALIRFSPNEVGPALLEELRKTERRNQAIEILVAMKNYDAIDPMLELAQNENENISDPAIEGLARLCDPDEHDLPRLLRLYLASRPGKHREKVERTIVLVCEKVPEADQRAGKLIAILEKRDGGLSGQLLIDALPLLGKVGNRRVADILKPLLDEKDPALQQAAIRALCNWPDAEPLDVLWNIAATSDSKQYRQWALRAYIRVLTLKSERPENETLALLQKAMKAAENDEDKKFCLSRAVAIRTVASVEWAADFLDDPTLAQTACSVIADLAHHRFLREPNKETFDPILIKVEKIAENKEIAERVRKSRLGM